MSNCNNCFNGCTEITSDKCVKYTGINIPTLGIETGDTLAFVEQKLIEFLLTTLDGTGVIIDLTGINVCALVQGYLPSSGDISIEDIAKALIRSSCDLQTQLNLVKADITTLNANYTIGCLSGVTTTSDTHDIVQATITKICEINTNLVALALELHTQYSRNGTELNNYIAAYLAANNPTSNKYYTRMVPYTVVEYYGTIPGNFDGTGKGLDNGPWEKIYLCNGKNPGVPDKRGVVGVGTTDGSMLGDALPTETRPGALGGSPFNPNYTFSKISGDNKTILTLPQIPSHNHTGSTAVDAGHTHTISGDVLQKFSSVPPGQGANLQTGSGVIVNVPQITTNSGNANISLTIASEGGNQAHSNVQVGLGCYYIMYVP
jgi:microcystin-dependent protein